MFTYIKNIFKGEAPSVMAQYRVTFWGVGFMSNKYKVVSTLVLAEDESMAECRALMQHKVSRACHDYTNKYTTGYDISKVLSGCVVEKVLSPSKRK